LFILALFTLNIGFASILDRYLFRNRKAALARATGALVDICQAPGQSEKTRQNEMLSVGLKFAAMRRIHRAKKERNDKKPRLFP
jgi:hypothetical protein